MNTNISTTIEDGLDFACNLAVSGIQNHAENNPERAPELLQIVAQYIQFRYVGETGLALEYLADIGNMLKQETFHAAQFWSQLSWIAGEMNLSSPELANLGIQAVKPS